MSRTTLRKMYAGFDVHKDTIVVAVADGNGSEARSFGTIGNNTADLERLLRRLTAAHPGRRWIFGYQAGPCGYPLARRLRRLGHVCHVIAPSLIPRRAGDRVKTDRRDALQLARL
ncbi:MAG TPA: transposase, partial [Bryobacterales bacterium]|nr:transposase [Bryobacterales bacterium]